MGGQGFLLLIGLKFLIMTSLQNIVISGAQGLLMLMGSKFLIKTHGSESRGQEEAACMRVFWPMRPLQ